MTFNDESPLLSVQEAATDPRYFGGKIAISTLYDAVRREEIPVVKIGKRRLIVRAKLEAMLRGEAG